jgi:hypothetical protein
LDKAQAIAAIIGAVLVPFAIGYAGNKYATAQKEAEIQVQKQQFDREQEIAQTNARVGQAGLIVSMLDALLSADPKRKKLATEAVIIGIPGTGAALVRIVSENDTDGEVRDFALKALARRQSPLISELFAENGRSTRRCLCQPHCWLGKRPIDCS